MSSKPCPVCRMECTNNAGLQSHLRRNASCYNLSGRTSGGLWGTSAIDVPATKMWQDKIRHSHQTGTWKGNKKE